MQPINANRPETMHPLAEIFQEQVREGERIVIEVYQGRFRGVISCRFVRCVGREIITGYPTFDGHPVPLRRDTEIQITAHIQDGLAIVTGFIDRVTQENEPLLVIHIPEENDVKFTFQRQFVRAETEIPITYRLKQKGIKSSTQQAVTQDLSGSGLSFISSTSFEAGQHIEIHLTMPGNDSIRVLGKVVRSTLIEKKPPVYTIAIAFLEITLADQDKIVHHIFELERASGDPSDLLVV